MGLLAPEGPTLFQMHKMQPDQHGALTSSKIYNTINAFSKFPQLEEAFSVFKCWWERTSIEKEELKVQERKRMISGERLMKRQEPGIQRTSTGLVTNGAEGSFFHFLGRGDRKHRPSCSWFCSFGGSSKEVWACSPSHPILSTGKSCLISPEYFCKCSFMELELDTGERELSEVRVLQAARTEVLDVYMAVFVL